MLNCKLRKQLREILKVYKRVEDSKTVEPERIKDDPRLERDLRELALLADLGALRGYVLVYTYCKPGDREVTWTGTSAAVSCFRSPSGPSRSSGFLYPSKSSFRTSSRIAMVPRPFRQDPSSSSSTYTKVRTGSGASMIRVHFPY